MLFLGLLTGAGAEEHSVIKNGDFESGNQYWTGDGNVITTAEGNRVGQIKASDRRFQMLKIEFELGELNEMEVRFQARYAGTNRKMRVKVETRGQGALMYTFDLPEDGGWRDCKFNYIRKPGVKKFDAVFQALLGEGTLQIDNVWGGKPGTYTPPPKTAPAATPPSAAPPPMPAGSMPPAGLPAPAAAPATPGLTAAAPGVSKTLEGSEWTWGSGGKLTLSSGGVARHTAWKRDGSWKLEADGKLTLKRPGDVPPMAVIFTDSQYTQGEVTSHTGASTTIKRVTP